MGLPAPQYAKLSRKARRDRLATKVFLELLRQGDAPSRLLDAKALSERAVSMADALLIETDRLVPEVGE